MKKLTLWVLCLGLVPFFVACGDEAGSDTNSDTDTDTSSEISIGGSLSQGSASSSSLGIYTSIQNLVTLNGITGFTSTERTVCSDGFFYGVACLNLATLDAEEGAVNCASGGSFEVSGLPKGGAIGCFIKRYTSATAALGDGVNVGTIQIPAANLSGQSENIVAAGDIELAVIISDDGTINATVTSGSDNIDYSPGQASASNFTAATMDGIWQLSCNESAGGDPNNVGRCKCFLGDSAIDTVYGGSQAACFADSNGPGAAITTNIAMGIDIHILSATLNSDLDFDNGLILGAGSTINGITIWGTSGEGTAAAPYVSLRTGGEGANDLDGALSWITASAVTAIDWSTTANLGGVDFTIPALPANTATQAVWMSWVSTIAANARASGVTCSESLDFESDHIPCLNRYYGDLRDAGALVPKLDIRPYCSPTGCLISRNASHSESDPGAFNFAQIMIEGLDFNYGPQDGTDNSALVAELDGMGPEPESRFVFEALEYFPGGAGFRTSDHHNRHFSCAVSGADIDNPACSSANYYQLRCDAREQLSIKFLGSSSPVDMVFDQTNAIVFAELTESTMNGPQPVQGVDPFAMCSQEMDQGGGAFFIKGIKQ